MSCRNRLQSNFRLKQEGDYVARQSFNLPNLKYYTQKRFWDYLKSFDVLYNKKFKTKVIIPLYEEIKLSSHFTRKCTPDNNKFN